tara:strand:+ start:606 stop:1070 length:465 start_codon:yes stop_codon:yes gene_type:complete
MGNWLFLMLLYAFFGWMKKKQRDKAREKIESQESWDTKDVVEFGEGILDSILGEEGDKKDEIISEQNVYENEERNLDIEIIEPDKEHDEIPNNIIFDEKTENLKKEVPNNYDHKIKRKNINVLNTLIDINNPAKTAIIFREILDKPRSLRRKIR